jgi:NhaP-type Na+/H+ or K+/H+ antiporter
MDDIVLKLAVIGAAGIAAQWFAWRLQLPAIVLLLAAGFIAGPATGFLDPAADFGSIYRPMVSIAVAIILFEGGLTLNFKRDPRNLHRRPPHHHVWRTADLGHGRRLPPIISAG